MLVSTSKEELTIGQLAEAVTKITGLRCTPAMIYNYEKQELLPRPHRSPGGVRKYQRDDIARVVQIKQAQLEGHSLEQIRNLLENGSLHGGEIPTVEIPNDKKNAILDAAAAIFPQKGYLETTLNDIAQEAGVAVSTVYQHFGSKENLFIALTESISFVQSLENIETALKLGQNGDLHDLRQAMINVANAFLFAPTANVEIIRLFITEVKRFPELGKVYRERLVTPGQNRFAEFLGVQIERRIFRPVDVKIAAGAFFGMFLNFVVNEYLFLDQDLEQIPSPDEVETIVDIFLRGVLLNITAL